MIKNDKQYQVTKNRLSEFLDMLKGIQNNAEYVDPIYKQIEENAVKGQIIQFEKEIVEYDSLKKGEINNLHVDSLNNIYEILIKARIIKGWTHAKLAKQLELKEQQIQRYELSNYSTASITRIAEVASALSININAIKVKINQPTFNIPEGFDEEKILNAKNKLRENRTLLPV